MRYLLGLSLICCVFTGAFGEAPEGEGWEPLFNGTDLAGWKVPQGGAIWKVVDGVIDCSPRTDLAGEKTLWSERSLGDFTLHVEWRLKDAPADYTMPNILPDGSYEIGGDGKTVITARPNADSGIYLRGSSKSQINIWCWPVGSGEVWGYRTDQSVSAEVRAGATPDKRADKPVGEWNTFVITMKGDRLTVVLNDQTVIDNAQLPGVPERGALALQHHGGYDPVKKTWNSASSVVQFRNVYVKKG
jgi:3-keto-disaccharide hydrolase